MLVLAIDTSCDNAGVALLKDGVRLCAVNQADLRTHSVKLLPEIQALLGQSGCTVSDLDLIAVTRGPGSFTGLRIGATTAKTLAYSASIPVVGVDTHDALAAEKGLCLTLIDARNVRAYSALYRDGNVLIPQTVGKVAEIIDSISGRFPGETVYVAGDGLKNSEITACFEGRTDPEFKALEGRLYPDPFKIAELGVKIYTDAGENAAERFVPAALTLNYMKEWK